MKKKKFPILVFAALLNACGPAAEDRDEMHRRAKIFQDSIANTIRMSMADAAAPGPNQAVAAPADTSKKGAAPSLTVK